MMREHLTACNVSFELASPAEAASAAFGASSAKRSRRCAA